MNELINFIKEFDLHNLVCIGVIFFIITRTWRNEVKEETKLIREEIAHQGARTDRLYEIFCEESAKQQERTAKLYEIFCEEICKQQARTDKLYEMFVDLLKET